MWASVLAAVGIGVVVTTLANVCTTVYLHRGLSHRALVLSAPARAGFRTLVWISTGIRPRQWVAVHRTHHAFTDVEGDPHSPVLLGWWTVQCRNVWLYRRAARTPGVVERSARDVPADAWDRYLFDRALLGLGVGLGALVALVGPVVGLGAAIVHGGLYLGGSAAVNATGHRFGRRPYANSATNQMWLALVTAGEGWHNNHHALPGSPRLSHRRFEIDPGWWVVRVLTATHLARLRRPPGVAVAASRRDKAR